MFNCTKKDQRYKGFLRGDDATAIAGSMVDTLS